MDAKRVNEILEEYMYSDTEDLDVRAEIIDRISGLSDDPDVKVLVGEIDSDHEYGFSVEVFENGSWSEYVIFVDDDLLYDDIMNEENND